MHNPTLGPEVCAWIEEYLCHGVGDVQGDPIVLDDEFRAFLWRAYEVFPQGHLNTEGRPNDGRRVFRQAFLSRPKGRAKSELAAMISCAELLGPVEFAGWDANGNPVGREHRAPQILNLATAESQVSNTFDSVVYMLRNGLVADEYADLLDVGITRVNRLDGGSIGPATSASRSADGALSVHLCIDECHLWTTPELHRLFNTVRRSTTTKRKLSQGWLLMTSTMYGPGEGSVAELLHKEHLAHPTLEGLLWDHKGVGDGRGPAEVDLSDEAAIRAALAYTYGPAAAWTDLDAIVQLLQSHTESEADKRRYYLNEPHKMASRSFDPLKWHALQSDRVVEPGTRVVLGFDGSRGRADGYSDYTVLVAWTVPAEGTDELPHCVLLGAWQAIPGGEIDAEAVESAVRSAFAVYDVTHCHFDPWGWYEEFARWERDYPGRIVKASFTREREFSEYCNRFEVALSQGRFTHDNNNILTAHVLNCIPRKTKGAQGGYVISKGPQTDYIDAATAAILGYGALGLVEQDEPMGQGVISTSEMAHAMGPERRAQLVRDHSERAQRVLAEYRARQAA